MLFQCRCRIVNEQIPVPVQWKRVSRVNGGIGGLCEVNGGSRKGIYGVMGVVEGCMRLTEVLETGIDECKGS